MNSYQHSSSGRYFHSGSLLKSSATPTAQYRLDVYLLLPMHMLYMVMKWEKIFLACINWEKYCQEIVGRLRKSLLVEENRYSVYGQTVCGTPVITLS